MLFSRKKNIFMYLVAFQKMFRKIFSDIWLCSWKYHKKHIFYLLLTFSHIFSVTKWIHNIIHSSNHKQNPEKKIIKSGQTKARSRSRSARSQSVRSWSWSRSARSQSVRSWSRSRSAQSRSWSRSAWCLDRSLSLSLHLFVECVLAECVSLFCACYGNRLKVKRLCKMISGSTSVNFGQMEIIFWKIYFP